MFRTIMKVLQMELKGWEYLMKHEEFYWADGDWENNYTHFLRKNTYFDLLFGSLIDENQSFSRKIILQYNKNDPVCCSYPYSESFSKNINEIAKIFELM